MADFSAPPKTSSSGLLDELPTEKWWGDFYLHHWEGFWYILHQLEAAMASQLHFEACDDDIILASSMKTGTTWLKALIPSIMNPNARAIGDDDDEHDPLTSNHPNELMPSLEIQIFKETTNPDLSGMPFPRLFRTHQPYTMLSKSIKNSACKIIYITRDPKDAFVSLWHFKNTVRASEEGPFSINEAFENFCNGVHPFGPFHDHVLEYWKESLKRPEKILFLKYEEMKRDPKGQVEKLASFLGRPFVKEEEVDKVLWRCSLDRLKNLEVNKNGVDPWVGMTYRSYFRLGLVGDWKNSLSKEMKERLDEITRKKLEGSGLSLGIS